jgi:hypothetical protein
VKHEGLTGIDVRMVGSFDFAIPPQLDVFGRDPVLAEVGIRFVRHSSL